MSAPLLRGADIEDVELSREATGRDQKKIDAMRAFHKSEASELVEEEDGLMGFGEPFTISWLFSITGAEYCHVYFWIFKDLAWTQEWRYTSLSFGSAATLWCLVIFYHAMRTRNTDEIYNTVALFMWIYANFWWMTGEVHDVDYPDEPPLADIHTTQSARILEAALIYLLFYYLVVIPLNLLPVSAEAIAAYDDGQYKPRFKYFRTFRQYENLHMLFWLAKDLAWNRTNIVMWFICLVPTVLVAADFLIISAFCKNSLVDTCHYAAVFLWVLGNSTWALGEFFFTSWDEPLRMWHRSKDALRTARWYSSWILLCSFFPIVIMYSIWIPLTVMGKFDKLEQKRLQRRAAQENDRDAGESARLLGGGDAVRHHQHNHQKKEPKELPPIGSYIGLGTLMEHSTLASTSYSSDDGGYSGSRQRRVYSQSPTRNAVPSPPSSTNSNLGGEESISNLPSMIPVRVNSNHQHDT